MPRFRVLTNLLLAVAIAAFGVKYGSRFLPERQPNRLAEEYSTYVAAASHHRINWYPFSPEGFERAKSLNRPIFLEIGSVFSRNARIFTDKYCEDRDFYRLLNNHFISIRVDAYEFPGVVQAVSFNTPLLLSQGGSLYLTLSPNGDLYQPSGFRELRSRREPLGLYEWISDIARDWIDDPDSFSAQSARTTVEGFELAARVNAPASIDPAMAANFAASVANAFDPKSGMVGGLVAPVAPPAIEMLAVDASPRSHETLFTYLLALRESSCFDQVHGGFFITYGTDGWQRPSYGKVSGTNALLAAAYARAANLFDAPLFELTARETARLLQERLRDGDLYACGVATDEGILEGSAYYDFSLEDLRQTTVFRLNLGLTKGPIGLRPVADARVAVSKERTERITQQSAILKRISNGRRPPSVEKAFYADMNGKVIAGMFETAVHLDDEELLEATSAAYDRAKATFVQPLGDVLHATDGLARKTGYLGDYVWMARAAIENYKATGRLNALNDAERIMLRAFELFGHPQGGLLTNLHSQTAFASFIVPIKQIADDPDDGINAVAARNMRDLAIFLGNESYRHKSLGILTNFSGAIGLLGLYGCGLVRAIADLFNPALLVKAPPEESRRLARRFPTILCAPLPPKHPKASSLGDGYYWVQGIEVTGPVSEQEVRTRLMQMRR